jgi:hypothetical protein
MTRSAPVATDCNRNFNALLVIGSILWCAPDMGVN